MLAIFKGYNTL